MISNYDDKAFLADVGKRHYRKEKKTSLFGSENPTIKTEANSDNYRSNKINSDTIISQNDVLRKDREIEEKKYKTAMEKKAILEELESYDPWGKPGAGAANINYSNEQNGNRAKWEYEQELQKMDEYKNKDDKAYPGFAPGFGCGNSKKNGRRSDINSLNEETNQNIYYPFGSPGGGAPMSEDMKKLQKATVTVHKNYKDDIEPRQKLEEAKAYADHLEQEIQRMKLKQMEDRYLSMKNENHGTREDKFDDNTNLEYEEDSLYREAENRARLRELERLKESYQHQDDPYDNSMSNNHRNVEYNQESYNEINSKHNEVPRVSLHQNEPKRVGSSSTHNDYRPYSIEEYMNSRQQLVNQTQLKRTTLSGSEEVSRNGRSRNFNLTDQDNMNKPSNNAATYNNIFPSDRTFSASKSSGAYSMKTPYATD